MALAQKNFEEIITFTRASAGGRFNSTGTYEMVPAGQQRIDYDPLTLAIKGFLVEEAKTNLLTRTNSIFAWSILSDISAQRDGTRFVDGVQPIVKLVEGLDANSHTAQTSPVSGDILADTTYTLSFFAKTAGRNINVSMSNGWAAPDFPSISVNLTDFTHTTTGGAIGKVVPIGGGFCRVSLTITRGPTPYVGRFVFRPANGAMDSSYLGDGISGVYVGGFQVEAGTVATSYTPSTDTFADRSSTAAYFDLNKTLKTAAVKEARSLAYDWDDKGNWKPLGLLEEAAATNLALQSNSATTFASLVQANYTDTGQLFIDGVSPLRKLVEAAGGTSHRGITNAIVVPANSMYTVSIVLKTAGRRAVRLATGSVSFDYDVIAMTATRASTVIAGAYLGTITPFGDGFVRITMTATSGSTDLSLTTTIFLLNEVGAATYAGDGVSGMFVGGYQVEVGASASSYIPTTTAQVTRAADLVASAQTTRAADVPVINDLGEWYNQSEGTLYVEAIPLGVPSGIYACLNDGNLNNRLQVDSVTTGGRLTVIAGGSTQVSMIGSAVPLAGQVQKTAASFKANDFAICANGGLIKTDTVGILPTMSRLSFMAATVGGQPNAHLRAIKYFPRKLTDAELQVLTV